MGFFDNLSSKLSEGGSKVASKAKEVSEIAALTATVEKEKYTLEKLYNEIGKKFYESYREELAVKFPEEVAKIDEAVKKIADSKEGIRLAKGMQVCPGCNKEVAKGTKFCPACGAVIPEPEVNEAVEGEPVEESKEEESFETNE